MKRSILFIVVLFIGCTSILFLQQKEIVEEVSVDYWVVPVFAVGKSGEAIIDLTSADIDVTVDNKKIENFTLMRKDFTGIDSIPTSEGTAPHNITPTPSLPIITNRARCLFLIFDTTFSTIESTRKSKNIARKLVEKTEKNTIFYILGIEPFIGLVYYGGQTNDKAKIISLIDHIVPRANKRDPEKEGVFEIPTPDDTASSLSRVDQRLDESDRTTLLKQAAEFNKFKLDRFQKSFESLYYAINATRDNKFVYLFTEGISNKVQEGVFGGRSLVRMFFGNISNYLGRSGAVLFILNPALSGDIISEQKHDKQFEASSSTDVRTESLRNNQYEASPLADTTLSSLAEKSGGKYFTGYEDSILARIDKMNHAYYEVFFPAELKTGNTLLKISIKSRRSGVAIHSLRTAEKTREYDKMEEIERQVLALNIISGNPLFKSELNLMDTDYKEISTGKGTVTYEVALPDSFVRQKLDVFKVYLKKDRPEPIVEQTAVSGAPAKLQVTFKKMSEGDETYFTIVNPIQKTCLVKGKKKNETSPYSVTLTDNSEEWLTSKLLEKDIVNVKKEDKEELERILQGAADYCEKLKKAAFHYICKETIVEIQRPLNRNRGGEGNIGDTQRKEELPSQFRAINPGDLNVNQNVQKKIKNEFFYRLLKRKDFIKELREKIEKDNKGETNFEQEGEKISEEVLKDIRFLSSKAVFGPITILDKERQNLYYFRLIGHEKLKDRPCTVIEAISRLDTDSSSLSGKLWIDSETFSVLKINANPNSILGNTKLRNLSKELSSKLYLTLETEYYKFYDGMRFPTRIHFLEAYKGGSIISPLAGSKGWERTESTITYNDYLFFGVDLDVTYENK